ncbi:MAG: Mu transposase C-terminal domain-containing protein, partial [Pyrinomonadaceae bacterium]
TYDLIEARIRGENQFRDHGDKLPIPHRNTLYRIINKLEPYEKDKDRFGKRIADLRHKVNKQGVRPSRPLERVEMDDTKLDVFVIDEKTSLPIGRPWLMVAICVFTKMILGYYLSFVKPSYLSVMQTLLHSIKPKTYVRERYPEIVHSWDAYGLPELLVVDNAKQYYSRSFDEACLQLQITTQYAPIRHPYYKPSVERMFGTLNKRLLHQIPGTTFSNVADKWDYDPKKYALISMQTLEKILHAWIVDVYHRSIHRGISDVPARRWEEGTKEFPPALPYNVDELNVLLGHIEYRSISSSGIEIWGLYYNHPSLSPLKSRHKKGNRVKIKYDPMDISLIHAYDSQTNSYLPVPAVDQDYTSGLTLWQHKVIKREARLTAEDYVDMEQLSLAKERIQKLVNSQFTGRSKSSSNVKAALWQDVDGTSSGRVEVSTQPRQEQNTQSQKNSKATRADSEIDSPTISKASKAKTIEIDGTQNPGENGATSGSNPIEPNGNKNKTARPRHPQPPKQHDSHALNDSQDMVNLDELDLVEESDLESDEFESDYNLPVRKS